MFTPVKHKKIKVEEDIIEYNIDSDILVSSTEVLEQNINNSSDIDEVYMPKTPAKLKWSSILYRNRHRDPRILTARRSLPASSLLAYEDEIPPKSIQSATTLYQNENIVNIEDNKDDNHSISSDSQIYPEYKNSDNTIVNTSNASSASNAIDEMLSNVKG
jgi:hypothetical protein